MHTKTALACVTLLVGALGAGSAFAQNAPAAAGALNGGGSMTCGDFMQLDHGQQASLVGTLKMNATPSSLTSNSGVGSATSGNNSGSNNGNNNGTNVASMNGTQTAPGNLNGSVGVNTPLTSGQLIAACQAATPTTSLQDAYSHFGASDSGQK